MKKSLLAVLIIVVLGLISFFVFKVLNKPAENNVEQVSPIRSAIQNAMYNDYDTDSADNDNNNAESTAIKEEKPSTVSVIKRAVKTVQKKLIHEATSEPKIEDNIQQESVSKDTSVSEWKKYTPEEEELLKKIPRSDEVVVGKEIKVRTSGKYIFK